MNKFAERLREALRQNGMSQNDLARKINISSNSISNYCVGRREPPLDVLILICKAVDETSDYLLGLID